MKEWDIKQKTFAERIQNMEELGYLRGDRINMKQLKDRFEKDLVERIALLAKIKDI